MRQGRRNCAHLERILFVCGVQNAGKSRLLRNMFRDPRFGTQGQMPLKGPLAQISLSYARRLFVKLSSPHERGETLHEMLAQLDRELKKARKEGWRLNFACAVQPNKTQTMPYFVSLCERIKKVYLPERIRVVQIHPQQDGSSGAANLLNRTQINRLWKFGVEMTVIDGRRAGQPSNGLLLADYFDFT